MNRNDGVGVPFLPTFLDLQATVLFHLSSNFQKVEPCSQAKTYPLIKIKKEGGRKALALNLNFTH